MKKENNTKIKVSQGGKIKPYKNHQRNPKKKEEAKEKKKIAFELVSDISRMERQQEYFEFIQFIALPRVMREEVMGVKTQEEFAKKYKINPWTLVEWKNKPGFWDDVHNYRKQFFKGRAADVWLALENTCIKEGRGQDVKVYFTLTGDYKEKTLNEHKLAPEVKRVIKKVSDFLDK